MIKPVLQSKKIYCKRSKTSLMLLFKKKTLNLLWKFHKTMKIHPSGTRKNFFYTPTANWIERKREWRGEKNCTHLHNGQKKNELCYVFKEFMRNGYFFEFYVLLWRLHLNDSFFWVGFVEFLKFYAVNFYFVLAKKLWII